MRDSFSDTPISATRRRLLLPAALLLAVLCTLVASDASAPAQTLQQKLQDTEGKLSHVRASQSSISATIAAQNKAIDSMIGEVSKLRQRQDAVEAELAKKQAELNRATAELAKERRHLQRVRAQLSRALRVLRGRLVAIYESGSPDVLNAVLESSSWSDLATQTEYLSRIQNYDDAVLGRVKALRNEVKGAVQRLAAARARIRTARDEIVATERQVASARAAAEARFAELKVAQAQRRQALEGLESREQALSDNLSAISSQMATEGAPAATSAPAPLTPGETAHFISESEASAPASAPAAVQAAISAANSIATTPYIWGGGHGSFESSGYDCSGAVSFALNGGGFLSSPLDSTGLETWGEPGPGHWITVYANAGHAWMMIAGLAFDTVGGPGPRWHSSPVDSPEGFIARHPAGY
jgi:peptidoglycan hydrolase CwlO-like protein